jgi:hypothetical protein
MSYHVSSTLLYDGLLSPVFAVPTTMPRFPAQAFEDWYTFEKFLL